MVERVNWKYCIRRCCRSFSITRSNKKLSIHLSIVQQFYNCFQVQSASCKSSLSLSSDHQPHVVYLLKYFFREEDQVSQTDSGVNDDETIVMDFDGHGTSGVVKVSRPLDNLHPILQLVRENQEQAKHAIIHRNDETGEYSVKYFFMVPTQMDFETTAQLKRNDTFVMNRWCTTIYFLPNNCILEIPNVFSF